MNAKAQLAVRASLWYIGPEGPAHFVSAIGRKRYDYGKGVAFSRYCRVWTSLCGAVVEQDMAFAYPPSKTDTQCKQCMDLFNAGLSQAPAMDAPIVEYCVPNPKYL